MNINKNHCINFCSKSLYTAQVNFFPHGSQKPIPTSIIITELNRYDIKRLKKSNASWRNTSWASSIINELEDYNYKNALKNKLIPKFFAIEIPDKKGIPRIKSLAMATKKVSERKVQVNYIQNFAANSEAISKENIIKGAGSCLMYAIIKFAKRNKARSISLYSMELAQDFYKKIGFKEIKTLEFKTTRKSFDEIAKTIEDRFFIKKA